MSAPFLCDSTTDIDVAHPTLLICLIEGALPATRASSVYNLRVGPGGHRHSPPWRDSATTSFCPPFCLRDVSLPYISILKLSEYMPLSSGRDSRRRRCMRRIRHNPPAIGMLHILYDSGIYGASNLSWRARDMNTVLLNCTISRHYASWYSLDITWPCISLLLCKLLRHILDYERGVGVAGNGRWPAFRRLLSDCSLPVASDFPYKRLEIKPLYPRRILKLVDKEIRSICRDAHI